MNWDITVFNFLNQYAGKDVCFDSLAIFLAEYLGYFLVAILILLLLKNARRYWLMTAMALAAAVLSRFVITEIIRFLWERPRPFVDNTVNLILGHDATGSFPSGHAAFFFAISTVVYSHNKKAGTLFFIASFLISLARVFAGVHWLTDIIGGALVGMLSGWIILLLSRRFSLDSKKQEPQSSSQ